MMAVQGVVWLLAIQAVCALAVMVWHRRHKHPDSWLVVTLCPIIAIVGQVFAIYLLFANIDVLAGTIGYVDLIGPIAIIGVAIGLGYAFCLKRRNRKKFDTIGRMIDEGQIDEAPAPHPRPLPPRRERRRRPAPPPTARSAACSPRARRRARRCRS